MNGWLNFKGDVVIREITTSDRITVSDNGVYISYNANNSAGLAKYMAEKGFQWYGSIGRFYDLW